MREIKRCSKCRRIRLCSIFIGGGWICDPCLEVELGAIR